MANIVRFTNGLYAIRKITAIGYRYKDLNSNHWYTRDDENFERYCVNCGEKVLSHFLTLYDKGCIVKPLCRKTWTADTLIDNSQISFPDEWS